MRARWLVAGGRGGLGRNKIPYPIRGISAPVFSLTVVASTSMFTWETSADMLRGQEVTLPNGGLRAGDSRFLE